MNSVLTSIEAKCYANMRRESISEMVGGDQEKIATLLEYLQTAYEAGRRVGKREKMDEIRQMLGMQS